MKTKYVFSVLEIVLLLLTLSMVGFVVSRICLELTVPGWLYFEMGGVFFVTWILQRVEIGYNTSDRNKEKKN